MSKIGPLGSGCIDIQTYPPWIGCIKMTSVESSRVSPMRHSLVPFRPERLSDPRADHSAHTLALLLHRDSFEGLFDLSGVDDGEKEVEAVITEAWHTQGMRALLNAYQKMRDGASLIADVAKSIGSLALRGKLLGLIKLGADSEATRISAALSAWDPLGDPSGLLSKRALPMVPQSMLDRVVAEAASDEPMTASDCASFAVPTSGNHIALYRNGDVLKHMFSDLRHLHAGEFAHLYAYMIADDSVLKDLCSIAKSHKRAGRDVAIRVIFNTMTEGGDTPDFAAIADKLHQAGIETVCDEPLGFSKLMGEGFTIQHRKGMVFGGHERGVSAWIGGTNLRDDYATDAGIPDSMVRVTGPVAVQASMTYMRAWRALGGLFSEATSDPDTFQDRYLTHATMTNPPQSITHFAQSLAGAQTEICEGIIDLLDHASDDVPVYIQMPYMTDEEGLIASICRRARHAESAGKTNHTIVVLPGISDSDAAYLGMRQFYPMLIESGVTLIETPFYFHEKGVGIGCIGRAVDGECATYVGSSNGWRGTRTYDLGIMSDSAKLYDEFMAGAVDPEHLPADYRIVDYENISQRMVKEDGRPVHQQGGVVLQDVGLWSDIKGWFVRHVMMRLA